MPVTRWFALKFVISVADNVCDWPIFMFFKQGCWLFFMFVSNVWVKGSVLLLDFCGHNFQSD